MLTLRYAIIGSTIGNERIDAWTHGESALDDLRMICVAAGKN